jgi:hypothetical protein
MKAPREQDLVRPALELLGLRGCFVFRNNSGVMAATSNGKRRFVRFGGAPGASDILGLLPGGRFVCVELKRPGRRPTAKQKAFLAAVQALDGLALVVSDLAELDKQIRLAIAGEQRSCLLAWAGSRLSIRPIVASP